MKKNTTFIEIILAFFYSFMIILMFALFNFNTHIESIFWLVYLIYFSIVTLINYYALSKRVKSNLLVLLYYFVFSIVAMFCIGRIFPSQYTDNLGYGILVVGVTFLNFWCVLLATIVNILSITTANTSINSKNN